MARVQRLLDERIIREVTPIFDTRALGYASMLVAAKVDAEYPHRAAKVINSHPGVTHNYLRNHDFNLWFTIAIEPGSKLGLQRHARRARRSLTGRGVDPPAADAEAVQDPHGPRDGEGHRRAVGRRRGGRAAGARADRALRRGRRDDPRDPGPDAGRARALRARRRAARRHPGRAARAPGVAERARRPAPRRRDPLPPPRRLLRQRHGRLEGARGPRSSSSARGWPPSAASRTATSARPTPDWPYSSSRWPTAAPRRSATRSSTRSPRRPGSRSARRCTRARSSRRSGCSTSPTTSRAGRRSTA